MFNFEEKINNIKVKKASIVEKNSIWLGIIKERESYKEKSNLLAIFNFKKHMIGALIALLILGGGGGVVAASNTSIPGDALFGIDTAVEKVRLNLTTDENKKNELRVKFAEERISEAKEVATRRQTVNTQSVDLSGVSVTEVEVDVFTNETTVKIEAGDRHYGFITTEKDKDKIVDEIEVKYNLSESSILSVLSFEIEDRASRPDDKGFLNSSNSEKEDDDLEDSLNSVSSLVGSSNLSQEEKDKLNEALNSILVILGNNPGSKFKFEDGDLKIEVKKGEVKIKNKSDDDSDDDNDDSEDDDSDDDRGHGNDDDGFDEQNPGQSSKVKGKIRGDVREDENEVFCRGEWRDPEDCEDQNGNSDDDSDDDDDDDNDDDNSGSGNDDDDNEDDDNDNDDDDDDNDNNDDDDNDDDDNSGSGN